MGKRRLLKRNTKRTFVGVAFQKAQVLIFMLLMLPLQKEMLDCVRHLMNCTPLLMTKASMHGSAFGLSPLPQSIASEDDETIPSPAPSPIPPTEKVAFSTHLNPVNVSEAFLLS